MQMLLKQVFVFTQRKIKMPNLNAIPDALVTFLNAGTGFSQSFTAQKKFYPTMEPAHYRNLRVYVLLPLTKTMALESRRSTDNRLGISFLVRKVVDKNNDKQMEDMLQLCDELCDYLFGVTIPNTKFTCLDIKFDALCDLEDLEQLDIFTGAFTLTYMDQNR